MAGDGCHYLTLTPTLALYSHEILVDLPRIFFSDFPEFRQQKDRAELAKVLDRILAIKPLIDVGVVQFYYDRSGSRNRHPSRNLLMKKESLRSPDPHVREAFAKLDAYMSTLDLDTAQSLWFSAGTDVSYLIRTAANAPGYFNICKHGLVSSMHLDLLLAISGLTDVDRGAQNLNKLLSVHVPGIVGMADQIALLHNLSDEFAEWRVRLGAALSLISDIEESEEEWVSDARATLTEELSPISERLKKAVRKSPAMQAMTSGMRTFSLAGVGTLTSGLLGGPLAIPATSLAAAKAVEAVATYVGARKEFRAHKAVLDVLLAFENVDEMTVP